MKAEAQHRKAKSEFDPIEKLTDKGVTALLERNRKKAEMDMCAAEVEACKSNLAKHKVYAPFGGVIGLKEISNGQYVAPGNELVKLVDCHPLKVDFKITEADIGNVYVGQEAKILVGGDNTQEYSAKIIAIDPESDKISHSFDVRALMDVPEEIAINSMALKPGRFVSVKVVPDANQLGILVPESALERIGDEYCISRVIDGIAARTVVTIGMRRDGLVEIITGINEGDIVITSGQHDVLDGRGVSIQDGALSSSLSDLVKQAKGTHRPAKAKKKKKTAVGSKAKPKESAPKQNSK
jgi:membrane fusion protein (multidrug efflux system)